MFAFAVFLGLIRCRVWVPVTDTTNVSALLYLCISKSGESNVWLHCLLNANLARNRSLLCDANVGHEKGIRITTTTGAHITSQTVLRALQAREIRKKREEEEKERRAEESKEEQFACEKPTTDIRRLLEFSENRCLRRKRLQLLRSLHTTENAHEVLLCLPKSKQ